MPDYDYAVVGGGFYGCCLALMLRSVGERVVLFEVSGDILDRASRVNQARVHTGFHYPRSFITALRSMVLHRRFVRDFPQAVVDDFQMLYAVARRRSKVSSARFLNMFQNLGAPISAAGPAETALFSRELVEGVFDATEFAFNYRILKDLLAERLERAGVKVEMNADVTRLASTESSVVVEIAGKQSVSASIVFNVTYSMINALLRSSDIDQVDLKHEFVEIALVEPPQELESLGVTVMDGPFFSTMPYPAETLHSLTHVRYTPHHSWLDKNISRTPYDVAARLPRETRWRHMMKDSARYLPCLNDAVWKKSLFDVKTVPLNSEHDDSRPILVRQHPQAPRIFSIMGGKIDNIYDLFELLPTMDPSLAKADLSLILGKS